MFKLSLVVVLAVLAVQCVNSNTIHKRNTDVAIDSLIRLQRDLETTAVSSDDDSTLLSSILSAVLSIVLTLVIGSICTTISPYLVMIELFRTTVIAAAVLIVEFVEGFIDNDTIEAISSGLSYVNTTISDTLSYISDSGCSI